MIETAREDELKFTVHALFALPELSDPERGVAAVQPRPAQNLRATYHDAPDLRLAREGITLRHRSGEGSPVWTLKLPAGSTTPEPGSGLSRDELSIPGPAREVPAELQSLLVAWLRGSHLAPVATLRTQRTLSVLCGAEGEELAQVVDDSVSVLEGRRVLERFREIEVELTGLTVEARSELRRRLTEAGASESDPLPKVVRALGPRAVAPGEVPRSQTVRSSDPAGALVTAAVRTSVRRLLLADIGVRRKQEDAVHQMRVACRRLRSDLKTFRPLIEPLWGESLRTECAWLAGCLGDARDLEVLRARLRDVVDAEPTLPYDTAAFARLDDVLARREETALASAAAALDSERYLRLLDVLVDAAREPVLSPAAEQRCSKVLPPLVRKSWTALSKLADRLHPGDPDDDWHEARIKAKQARYAAEAVVDVLGRPAARLSSAAKNVQEVLGEHQDGAIAAETLVGLAAERPDDAGLAFVAGRLAEWNRGDVARTRREFPAVWKKASRAAR
ncbi:MAG TPA: CYTH and CHAD domain-containing protein [Frankiaceae bacterium]|nr:CYTH and CHAD domain-containing protein [Frankiaceae bacterium]